MGARDPSMQTREPASGFAIDHRDEESGLAIDHRKKSRPIAMVEQELITNLSENSSIASAFNVTLMKIMTEN